MTGDGTQPDSLYRVLFEKNPAPLWVYDIETLRFLMVNEAAVEQYGFSRDEFTTMTLADIRPPEERPRLAAMLRDRHDGVYYDVRHWRKDGVRIDVRMVSHAITLGGRNARLVVAEDVTEQRRTSEQLRSRVIQQEALAELGQRALQDGGSALLVRDAAALVARTLDLALVQILERRPAGPPVSHASVVGGGTQSVSPESRAHAATMVRLSAPNDAPLIIDDLAADARFAGDTSGIASAAAVEIPGIAFDGALVALATVPKRFAADDVNYLRAVAATLGAALERNRAERARQESEERAFDILNSLSESVVLLAEGARIHWCNRTAAMLLGCPVDQVVGRSSGDLGLQIEDVDGRRLLDRRPLRHARGE